jgi:hypothetical protein
MKFRTLLLIFFLLPAVGLIDLLRAMLKRESEDH